MTAVVIAADAWELLPLLRELYSRRPEYRCLQAWELQTLLWSLGSVEALADEGEIAAAREVALTETGARREYRRKGAGGVIDPASSSASESRTRLTDLNVTAAERGINDLIERRAAEREQASQEARAWSEGVRRYDLRRAAELRAEWAEFYRAQIRAAEAMRERAVERLARLIDQGAGRADPIPGRLPHAR